MSLPNQLHGELSLKSEQKQLLSLSYVRRQMINMISMNTAELGEYVRAESSRNLCLEIDYHPSSVTDVIEATAVAPVDFRQDLRLQLSVVKDMQLYKAACCIIEALDNDGLLRETIPQLARRTSIKEQIIEKALRLVQSLEPPGIAARNFRECFLLQLKRKGLTSSDAWILVHDAFELLREKDVKTVCSILGWEKERFHKALSELKKLTISPAGIYTDVQKQHIIPDAEIIRDENGQYVVRLFEQAMPKVHISEAYLSKFEGRGNRFANEGIFYARRFLYCLERRNRTLLSIFQYAVDNQVKYLEGGPLKRLLMRDVARALKLHPSTVTRAISNKYVLFAGRVFPASTFFTNDGVSGVSSDQIKKVIDELIKSEEPYAPYSDQLIANILCYDYMVNISRRTVAKYRKALGIPSSKERKNLCHGSRTFMNS